jgi:hypothetical protein
MGLKKTLFLLLLALSGNDPVNCQTNISSGSDTIDYYTGNSIVYDNHTYKPSIQSIMLFKQGFELTDPILQLYTDEKFELQFDDLEADVKEYYYSFTHCDASWTPTEIWRNEYLNGLMEDVITQYDFSFNTRQPYTHYSTVFPNDRISFLLSGNYLLRVYTKSSEGDEILALTRRFLVFDPKVSITARVLRATTIEEYETNQEIDFIVNTHGYRIDAPYQDIQVVILQNNRWDNALAGLKPFMVKGEELDYSYDNGLNQFGGGNEFRSFDTKSIRHGSEKVKELGVEDGMLTADLWMNERKTFKKYVIEPDINGQFLLHTEDERSVEIMGEYLKVKFFLSYPAPVVHGAIYVAGAFNGWQYTPGNKMRYNFQKKGYEADILLKQGYFDYKYILLPNNSNKGDETYIEGNHFETENMYTVLIYHRVRGTLYDQLIAVGKFNSMKK